MASAHRLRRKRRKHQHTDESDEQRTSPQPPGLAGMQQSVGNRAIQRLLLQRQVSAEMRTLQGQQEPDEVVDQADRELLSGEHWVHQFPASAQLVDLDSSFGECVTRFVNALEAGSATVEILSTYWPPERAYLMHFAWLIANDMIDARQVPPIEEVDFDTDVSTKLDIVWWHGNQDDSQMAAAAMVKAFGLDNLEQPPVLASKHVAGEAIDMHISWGNSLLLKMPGGDEVEITSPPNDETNPELMALGAAFGVIHYGDPDEDAVHWSVDGT